MPVVPVAMVSVPVVPVFFYGTFMSARVLRSLGVRCEETVPCALRGYRLEIGVRADLVADPGAVVYGGLADVDDDEVAGLYSRLLESSGLEDRQHLAWVAFDTPRGSGCASALAAIVHPVKNASMYRRLTEAFG